MRLVKGAYWDSEIKRAQERGHAGYPVFTRKVNTDVSYIACARELIGAGAGIYPQFATHNAQTVATIMELAAQAKRAFEFQRLHGMGEELYAQVVGADKLGLPCRVYAPVGSHEDLLPYLVRRLLENGANTSFVNRIVDEQTAIADIVRDPVAEVGRAAAEGASAHPAAAAAVWLVAVEFARRESRRSVECEPLQARHRSGARERWAGGRDRLGQAAPGPRRPKHAIRPIATKSSAW